LLWAIAPRRKKKVSLVCTVTGLKAENARSLFEFSADARDVPFLLSMQPLRETPSIVPNEYQRLLSRRKASGV
jgi:hypothetical protein